MAAPHRWNADDDAELKRRHAAGESLHSIAKTMDRSKDTISRKARALGLSWSRERTAKAAEAVAVDNKARRVAIVARMYGRIEHIQDRLEADQFKTTLKGEHGVEHTEQLDFVPTTDERNLADTISRYVASAVKLEQVDSGDKPQAVRDLLTGLAGRLGIVDGP